MIKAIKTVELPEKEDRAHMIVSLIFVRSIGLTGKAWYDLTIRLNFKSLLQIHVFFLKATFILTSLKNDIFTFY